MENIMLTKFAKELLCAIYSEYKRKIEDGGNAASVQYFAGADYWHRTYFAQKPTSETVRALMELDSHNLIDALFCDNTVGEIYLTDQGIVFMETQKTRNVDAIFQWIERIRSLFPF